MSKGKFSRSKILVYVGGSYDIVHDTVLPVIRAGKYDLDNRSLLATAVPNPYGPTLLSFKVNKRALIDSLRDLANKLEE